MEEKVLTINSNKDLIRILKRKDYTSLIINEEVNPKLLYGFENVKELEINHQNATYFSKVENKINTYFKNIEKLKLKNIKYIGQKSGKNDIILIAEKLNTYNLKSITFEYDKNYNEVFNYINTAENFLMRCSNLEEININFNGEINTSNRINIPNSVNKIKLFYENKEYLILLEQIPFKFLNLNINSSEKNFFLNINNNIIETKIDIDIVRDIMSKENTLVKLCNSLMDGQDCLYIPDIVNNIDYKSINYNFIIKHISLNNNLLKNSTGFFNLTDKNYLDLIETITIRYDNDMSLFPNKVINVKEYGVLVDLCIKDNNLCLYYQDKIVKVNEEGIINIERPEKEEKQEVNKDEEQEFTDLDKYTINELEEYLQYRKLLEKYKDNEDIEFVNAINVIGKKLVKKLG